MTIFVDKLETTEFEHFDTLFERRYSFESNKKINSPCKTNIQKGNATGM